MKKKEYSSAEVEILLREMAAAYRCTMEEALTARILSAVEDELRRGRRRRLYKRSVQAAAAVAVLGAVSVAVWDGLTPAVVSPAVVAAEVPAPKPHRVALSELDAQAAAGFAADPHQLCSKQDNGGVCVPRSYQFTACTNTL